MPTRNLEKSVICYHKHTSRLEGYRIIVYDNVCFSEFKCLLFGFKPFSY